MKRLLVIFILLLVIYATYYDLSSGTLPEAKTNTTTQTPTEKSLNQASQDDLIEFQEVIVDSGYTVLSIVEHLNEGPLPSIQQIIEDFKSLNPGTDADQIKVGQTYLFPLYEAER